MYRSPLLKRLVHAKWQSENPDKCRGYTLKYQCKNREKVLARQKLYRKRNKAKIAAAAAEYYRKNRETIRAKEKSRFVKNPQRRVEYARAYRAKNLEKFREWQRNFRRKQYATPKGNIDARMTAVLRRDLQKRGGKHRRSWERLVGYTAEELKLAIEKAFEAGMNWGRFLAGQIHIDHVIPKSKFKYESAEDIEFKRCWAIENLKPKWAEENLRKNAKVLGPAQIPLGI